MPGFAPRLDRFLALFAVAKTLGPTGVLKVRAQPQSFVSYLAPHQPRHPGEFCDRPDEHYLSDPARPDWIT
jgi:hypothetical protein